MPDGNPVLHNHSPPPARFRIQFQLNTMAGMPGLTKVMIVEQRALCFDLLDKHGVRVKKRSNKGNRIDLLVVATEAQIKAVSRNPKFPPGIIMAYELHRGGENEWKR